MTLLAVPNVSEGRDAAAIEAIGAAFASAPGVALLDVHADADHHRSVYTLAGAPGTLAPALLAGARAVLEHVDMRRHDGAHPCVGALDVAPVVHREPADRGAACAEALLAADLLAAELGLPVFLYGALGGGRTRASLRRGGVSELAARVAMRELVPDFGPRRIDPGAGATLVAARPPLVAFNLELAPPAGVEEARAIAALVRDGGPEGLPGVRAIGVELATQGVAQVSANVEDHLAVPLARLVEAVRAHAPVAVAEIVGIPPAGALDGFPADVPIRDFDPATGTLESALASLD